MPFYRIFFIFRLLAPLLATRGGRIFSLLAILYIVARIKGWF